MNISKEKNFSDWYNAIIKEAELCDLRYNVKGFVVFMPWAVMSIKRMYRMYETELEAKGHVPALFPALIPESNLKRESEHVAGFVPEVMWVTHAGNEELEERYAMRPTSETAMYPMYALWINGKKDLPLKLYQSCQVWRHETKATKPFIRSREFYWIEAHNCFATEKDAMDQVHEDMEMAEKIIHGEFAVPFLFFKRPQWDKFAGADNTFAADTLMPDGKTIQQPSTHMLGQHFSKAFGVKFMDADGESKYVWQTCYGPAISRIYASVIAFHGDDNGLVMPFDLAPVQIAVIPIYREGNKEKLDAFCKKLIKSELGGYAVKYDDSEKSPGFKYNHWELRGVPVRIDIGERDIADDSVMICRRDTKEKTKVKISELKKKVEHVRVDILKNLKERADAWFKKKLHMASEMDELHKILEIDGGFIRVPFCTDAMEGEKCADAIKEKCKANVRGSLFTSKDVPKNEKCISCGGKANIYLYVARQY